MNFLPSLQKTLSKLLTLPFLSVILFVISSISPVSSVYAQMDLPNPPANFETIAAGSFVIPMDTINQAIVPAGDAPFNIKAYGLVNKFLQNGIPVKWAIRAGKARDAIDFSANATRVFPTAIGAANVNFIAGPFIVTDTVLPCGLSTTQIIQNFGNNVAVFQLQQSVSVDIRYTLVHRPKIAVFNNGGNQQIHIKILNAAGIPDYTVLSAAQITTLADCFTFASEPHADSMNISVQMVNGIQQFVANGGNFLGQCQTVNSYEKQGFYHTTSGIAITNNQLTNTYSNSDMAAAQIHGPLSQNRFGSCQNWTLKNGSAWRPYYYPMVTDPSIDTVVFVAAHLTAPTAVGGNVYFLGGHDYGRVNGPGGPGGPGGTVADLTDLQGVNGMRYYLNAAMIPSYNANAAWANAGPDIVLSCGDSASLGCSQTGPVNATFAWSPSAGLSCTNCPNPVAQPSVTTTYVVTVGMSCNATDTVIVTVNSAASITVNNAAICPGSSATLTGNGGISYSWSPAAGLSATTGASVTANPSSTTVYTVTGTNASGCSASVLSTVTVNSLPVVAVNSPSICNGDSVNLNVAGGVNYSWSPSTGLNNTTGNTVIAQPGVTTIYTVTATDANGCSNTASSNVTVNAIPALVSPAASICIGGTAVLNVTGTPAGNIYNWSTGTTGASISVSPSTNTTYTVTGTGANGCTSSISVPVTVNQFAPINVNSAAICPGSSVTLTGNGGVTYTWSPAAGLSSATGAVVTASPSTNTNYTVTGTNAGGCTGTAVAAITINSLPVISANSPLICNGDSTMLAASGGVSYSWSPSTGLNSTTGSTVLAQPAVTTIYTVTGTDANGCINTTSAAVTVNAVPSLTSQSASVCVGGAVVLNVSGTPSGNLYSWSTGTTGTSVSVSPNANTSYTVTGTSSNGCTASISVPVIVNQLPVIITTDTVVCAGSQAAIHAQGAQNYSWLASTGQNYTGASVVVNPVTPTSYTVTGTDMYGCINTAVSNVAINLLPIITSTTDSICRGETASLLAAGGISYHWMPGNISTASLSVSPSTTSVYTVTGSDASGCANTASSIVIVNSIPTITAASAGICFGDTTAIIASGASSYTWQPSGISGNALSASPASTTQYTVTGYSSAGCSNTAFATVTVNPKPNVNFNVIGSGCAPVQVVFQNLTTGNIGSASYQWTFGDGTTSSLFSPPSQVFDVPGNFDVKLIVKNGGCTASLAKPKVISVYPTPKAGFVLDNEVTDINKPNVHLFNRSIGDSIRYWDFGDGQTDLSGIMNPVHTYSDTGTYTICLVVSNSNGCVDKVCNDITVKPIWSFYIPNAFTPNNDDFNDGFIGKSVNVTEHEMWIYDRWGVMIYTTGKTRNPETAKPWDGKPAGASVPAQNDVYVWVVNLKDIEGMSHRLIGHVTLVK